MKSKPKSLVINKEAGAPSSANLARERVEFTANVLPKLCRNDRLESREVLVVPMVMITEGVHNGSAGPILYSEQELSAVVEVWNHKPVCLYHPERNGQGVSACSPDMVNSRKVGTIFNTKFEQGKLKAEAWIEVERAREIDPRIMEFVDNGRVMEVSTGLYMEGVAEEGEWNGKAYSFVARNLRADHLALLPDQVGACSVADGAGLCRNAAGDDVDKKLLNIQYALAGPMTNALSHESQFDQLSRELRSRFVGDMISEYEVDLWIRSVFDGLVVYWMRGKFWASKFSVENDVVKLSDEAPVEALIKEEFIDLDGVLLTNAKTKEESPNKMKEIIDRIIAMNKGWTEEERATLEGLGQEKLEKVENGLKAQVNNSPQEGSPAPQKPAVSDPEDPKPTANAGAPTQDQPQTVGEAIAQFPPQIQAVLNAAVNSHTQRVEKLKTEITDNKRNRLKPETLERLSVDELEQYAESIREAAPSRPVGNYGMAGLSSEEVSPSEVLELPVINYGGPKNQRPAQATA